MLLFLSKRCTWSRIDLLPIYCRSCNPNLNLMLLTFNWVIVLPFKNVSGIWNILLITLSTPKVSPWRILHLKKWFINNFSFLVNIQPVLTFSFAHNWLVSSSQHSLIVKSNKIIKSTKSNKKIIFKDYLLFKIIISFYKFVIQQISIFNLDYEF